MTRDPRRHRQARQAYLAIRASATRLLSARKPNSSSSTTFASNSMNRSFYEARQRRRPLQHGADFPKAIWAIVPPSRAATSRSAGRFHDRHSRRDGDHGLAMGIAMEKHHHEVAPASMSWPEVRHAAERCRSDADLQVCRAQRGATAMARRHLHAEADRGRQRLGHACASVDLERRQAAFAGSGYADLSDTCALLYRRHHQARQALNAFTNPSTNSYKRLVPGFEAPVLLAYSARNRSASCRIPYATSPNAKRVEVRFPDPTANPYLAFSAMLMAGLDGIENKIHPGDPMDKDLYDLPPEELEGVPTVCSSLGQALEALERRSRLPQEGRRLHRRSDRWLHRTEAGRAHSLHAVAAPGRVPDVLLGLEPVRTHRAFQKRRPRRSLGGAFFYSPFTTGEPVHDHLVFGFSSATPSTNTASTFSL